MKPDQKWASAENILCVRLDTMGDVLMTTPAIRALKESTGRSRVTLLTSAAGAEVVPLVPEIDRTIVYEASWMKTALPDVPAADEFAMIDKLKRERFDAAVIFTVYSQSPLPAAFLCHLAGIPLRLAHCHENHYRLLTHWVPDPEPAHRMRHEVERQLDLVATVGMRTRNKLLSLRVPAAPRSRVTALLQKTGVDLHRCWLIIHPGATAPSRRYPAEHFAAVARHLVKEAGFQIVFTGTADESSLIERIRHRMEAPSFSLAGRIDLAELAALIGMAPLLIANNTGPVHLAAALGVKVVDLYALTNPQHTPWGVKSKVLNYDVPCKYCYKSVCPEGHYRCLRLVPPSSVIRAARTLLKKTYRHLQGVAL
jgi:lipopolysaccharide heptosyltransferase II